MSDFPHPALFDPAADPVPSAQWPELPAGYPVLNPGGLDQFCQLLPLAEGRAAAVWPHQLSVYDAAGRLGWRIAGRNLKAAAHPDGHELLVCHRLPPDPSKVAGGYYLNYYELTRYEAATGRVLEVFALPVPNLMPFQLTWLPNGDLVVLGLDKLCILGPDRRPRLPWPATEIGLLGAVWQPERPDELLLAGQGPGGIRAVALASGRVLREATTEVPLPWFQQPGVPLLAGLDAFSLLDPATLAERWGGPLPGPERVRFADEDPDDPYSGLSWQSQASLGPAGRWLLLTNGAGQLWLLDACGTAPPRAFGAALGRFVLAVCWLSATRLLVLGHLGRLRCLDLTQPAPCWEAADLLPADEARLLLDAPPEFEPAPPAPPVLDTLAAMAAATTPAAYAGVGQQLDPFLIDADWDALPLTPAHLAALWRYFLWCRPLSGFDLAPLATLRQQLATLAGHVPGAAADAAAALTLHDQLLFGHQLLRGKGPAHTTQQLRQRYLDLLVNLDQFQPLDARTGQPFPGTPAYADLLAANAAAEELLAPLTITGCPYLLEPVLMQLAARFPADFRRQLLALTPSEQHMLLGFLDFSRQPALLRELAALPDKAVRNQAQKWLRKIEKQQK